MSIKKITTLALFLAAISSFGFAKEITIVAVMPATSLVATYEQAVCGCLVKCA